MKTKSARKIRSSDLTPGVVVLHNIPHGFYEDEMKKFFTQFGTVLRLRLSRSRKTGKSRGYAYIEFECDEVAKIVAETMDNYLMFNHILRCKFIPPEKRPVNLFRKKLGNTTLIQKSVHNKDRPFEKEMELMKKRLNKVKKMENKLSEMGISFKCEIVNVQSDQYKEDFDKKHPTKPVVPKTKKHSIKKNKLVKKRKVQSKNFESKLKLKKGFELLVIPPRKLRKNVKTLSLLSLPKYSLLQGAVRAKKRTRKLNV